MKRKLSPSEYALNLFKGVWKTTIWNIDHKQSKFSKHLTVLQKPQHSACFTGYNWKMENYFEEKTRSGYSFYEFVTSVDTLDHSLLLTKLNAYGFDNNSFIKLCSKLFNKQNSKIKDWESF